MRFIMSSSEERNWWCKSDESEIGGTGVSADPSNIRPLSRSPATLRQLYGVSGRKSPPNPNPSTPMLSLSSISYLTRWGISIGAENWVRTNELRLVCSIKDVKRKDLPLEENLLDSVLGSLVSKDETVAGQVFLEANIQDESCQTLLTMWNHLKLPSQKVLSLIARVNKLEKEKECLILNLSKAEQEVELVSKQNRKLDKENHRLLRQQEECIPLCSASVSAKSNKRKSSHKAISSPVEKKIEFSSPDLTRKPLSPVWYNSPDSRMNKK